MAPKELSQSSRQTENERLAQPPQFERLSTPTLLTCHAIVVNVYPLIQSLRRPKQEPAVAKRKACKAHTKKGADQGAKLW